MKSVIWLLEKIDSWLITQSNRPKRRYGIYMLIVCVTALLISLLWHFSLPLYYFFALGIIIFSSWFLHHFQINSEDDTKAISIFTVIAVAVLSSFVFETYYNAKDDVFYNVDHHALALKGYTLTDEGVLFGNDRSALFEDTTTTDVLAYQLKRDSDGKVVSIRLRSDNFNRSFFVRTKGCTETQNKNTRLTPFKGQITFKQEGIDEEYKFLMFSYYEQNDSAFYIFSLLDANKNEVLREESSYHGFIQKSYPLEDLIPSAITARFHDKLQGYSITREKYNRAESARESDLSILGIERLAKLSFRKHPFVLEQTGTVSSTVVTDTISDNIPFDITISPNEEFFISFGQASTNVITINEKGQLLFNLPIYRPLANEKDICQMFVSTSDAQICQGKADYNIFFPVNQSEHNKNLFKLTISFEKGKTTQPLYITINNDSICKAGQEFFINTNNSQYQAILSLVDFKANTVFNSSHFRLYLLIIFMLCILCLCINNQANWQDGKRFAPTAELVCIILLLVFFTTRYLLCWRISVFPPLEDTTIFEHDIYQNRTVFNWIWVMIALIGIMIIIKGVCLKWFSIGRKVLFSSLGVLALCTILFLLSCIGSRLISSGFTHILIPVITYFIIEIIIAGYYSVRTDQPLKADAFLIKRPFLINYSCHLALLMVSDTGYGVMFFFFGILRYYLLLFEYVVISFKTTNNNEELSWLRPFPDKWQVGIRLTAYVFLIVLGITIFLFLRFLQHLLSFGMNNSWFGCMIVGGALVVAAGFIVWLCIPILLWIKNKNQKFQRAILGVFLLLTVVGLYFIPDIYNHTIGPDTKQIHIRYRTKVLVESWDDILNNEKMSNAKNVARFRQTSENQWILDNYYKNRVHFSDDYFKLQPMNKTGAMWGAQATDISFLRFGIAEHGSMYALFIFILLLTALLIVIRQPRYVRSNRQIANHHIAVGAILLIVLQAVFVWMSVTNRFIFFGQDFPMLSITSKSSLLYFVFLLFLTIILMIPIDDAEDPELSPYYKNVQKWISTGVFGFFILFGAWVYFYSGSGRANENKQSYKLTMNETKKVLRLHNNMLLYFQLFENAQLMKKANSYIIGKNQGRNKYGQDLFLQFNSEIYNNIEADEGTVSNDCIITLPQDSTLKFPLIGNQLLLHNSFENFANKRKGDIGLEYGKDSVTVVFTLADNGQYSSDEKRLFQEINRLFTIYQVENAGLRNANLAVFNSPDISKEVKLLAKEIRNKLEDVNLSRMMQEYKSFLSSHSNDSIIRVCQENLENIPGAIFTKSLIDVYTNNYSKNNNPDNLISLVRNRQTHYLEFKIKEDFFNIPELSKDKWKGNIVADDKYGNDILMKREGKIYRGETTVNKHFSDFKVQRSWLPPNYSNDDQFVFRSFAPIKLMLNGLQAISLPHNGYHSIRISGMDVLSIQEAQNVPKVSLPTGDQHTFAKNIWFNGHRRMIFTLGKKLFWIRSYNDYLAAVMNDSSKVEPLALSANHQISLDYDLNEQLYDIMEKYHSKADDSLFNIINKNTKNPVITKEELSHKFCIFVGNSDGQIVAMPDYNSDSTFRISPNDIKAVQSKRRKIDLFSTYSDERSLYGNYNLLPLQFGPGSSLKPLSFSAVSAAYDNNWNSFTLESALENCIVYRYAGKEFNENEYFASISSDEPKEDRPFYVSDYLAHSSNFFNSAIIFIGSFSHESIQEGVFKRMTRINKNNRDQFPVMRIKIGDRHYFAVFDKIPQPKGKDSQPIIMESFMSNYELYDKPKLADTDYKNRFILEPELREGVLHRNEGGKIIYAEPWVMPEPSYIDYPLWSDPSQLSYAQRIKTLTLGMRRVISVSPLKMAEMYSRLFLLDKNFRYTLSIQPYNSSVDFDARAYDSVDSYLNMLKGDKSLFAGMRECALSGTARYLNSISSEYNQNHKDSIYFYAKTGTINDASVDRKMRVSLNDALLAVIITNADMKKAVIKDGHITVNDKPVKFYVVYIFMDKFCKGMGGIKSKIYKDVFRTICNSKRFKMFINDKEKKQ